MRLSWSRRLVRWPVLVVFAFVLLEAGSWLVYWITTGELFSYQRVGEQRRALLTQAPHEDAIEARKTGVAGLLSEPAHGIDRRAVSIVNAAASTSPA